MSLLFMEGFSDTTYGDFHTEVLTSASKIFKTFNTPFNNRIVLGCNVKWSSSANYSQNAYITLRSVDGKIIAMGIDAQKSTGPKTFRFYVAGSLVYSQGAKYNEYHYFETKIDIGTDNNHVARVYLDGELKATHSFTNSDLFTTLDVVQADWSGYGGDLWLDDMYVVDGAGSIHNDIIGPVKIHPCVPVADGTYKIFTPSVENGTNYQRIDGVPADSEFVSSDQKGAIDTYQVTQLQESDGDLIAVRGIYSINKTESGARQMQTVMKDSNNQVNNNSFELTYGSHIYKDDSYFTTAPDGSQWTIDKFNNTQFGFRISE